MKGAIIGDIIGSAFISSNSFTTDIQLLKPISSFTDDTILTIATADSIMHNKGYAESMKEWVTKFPKAGYNPQFLDWAISNNPSTYLSSGNGSARRISPIGFAARTLEEAMCEAKKTAVLTHNYDAKIKASQAVASSIFLLKNGMEKAELKSHIETTFAYNLDKTILEYSMEVQNITTENSPVPAAVNAFLNSTNFEDAVRKAIALGGPSNTLASITGGIAYAYYKHIPKSIIRKSLARLNKDMINLIYEFESKYFNESVSHSELLHL